MSEPALHFFAKPSFKLSIRSTVHESSLPLSIAFARQQTVSPLLFCPGARPSDVLLKVGVTRALHWYHMCPGSTQRIYLPFTLSYSARGIVCLWAGRLLLPSLPSPVPAFADPLFRDLPLLRLDPRPPPRLPPRPPPRPPRATPLENSACPIFFPFDTRTLRYLCRTTFSICALVISSRCRSVRCSIS